MKQSKNAEGRVFKVAYGDRTYCELLLDAIQNRKFNAGLIADDNHEVFDKASIAGLSKANRYWINKSKEKINSIRAKNNLKPIPLQSMGWNIEEFVLEGLEDQPYAQVI